jgi:NADH dehydrogenase
VAQRPRVVIVGAGFAGLAAAKALRRVDVDAVIVERHNYHLFLPLLYQVASGLLDPSEIAHPVRTALRRARNVDVRMAEVVGVDMDARQVTTSVGTLDYDALVLATGSVDNYYGLTPVERRACGLKSLEQGLALRSQVLRAFEQASVTGDENVRRRLLSFAVVGGGPTGVEYCGALGELIHRVLPKDFRHLDFTEVSITLVEGTDQVLGTFAPRLGRKAADALERRGVRVLLGRSVTGAGESELVLDGGERLPAGTIVWAAGVQASPVSALLGVPAQRQGRVAVTDALHLADHPEVFIIGDAAEARDNDETLPMLAAVAIQQGKHVARVIDGRLRGRPDRVFHYFNKGTMATVGRACAVAEVGPIRVNGFVGWLMWLGLHFIYIIGFRSRAVVLISWFWNFLFYDRPVRLIVDYPEVKRATTKTRR